MADSEDGMLTTALLFVSKGFMAGICGWSVMLFVAILVSFIISSDFTSADGSGVADGCRSVVLAVMNIRNRIVFMPHETIDTEQSVPVSSYGNYSVYDSPFERMGTLKFV